MAKNIAEGNEKSEIESLLQVVTDSKHLKPLIFLHHNHSLLAQSLQTVCAFLLS